MAALEIQRLGPGDVDRMRELNALFAVAFDDAESYAAAPPDESYLARLLAKSEFFALVAVDNGVIVGGLAAYRLDKFEQARAEIYIYDLAVAVTHRRQGAASALIGRLREIAAEQGVWVIYVQADHGDDAAVALYTRLGVREDVMHFDIAVRPKAVSTDRR